MTYLIFAGLSGLIHVYIFTLESILWGKPKTNKAFGMTEKEAKTNKLFAFNQGFYNLFLAIAVLMGIELITRDSLILGRFLITYGCASMLGAALVLLYSKRQLYQAALIQGLPPAITLGLIYL